MKLSHEKPAIYERCKEAFGASWNKGVIITYGDTVYSKFPIADPLVIHEGVHIEQQAKMGKDIWWNRYFVDPEFRLSQEVEAYREQVRFINYKYSRDERRKWKKHIIKSITTMYGNICTEEEAEKLIYEKAN